jgi:hypothetical protein
VEEIMISGLLLNHWDFGAFILVLTMVCLGIIWVVLHLGAILMKLAMIIVALTLSVALLYVLWTRRPVTLLRLRSLKRLVAQRLRVWYKQHNNGMYV